MIHESDHDITVKEMTDAQFSRLGEFIHEQCGIKMPLSKKTMLQTRLHKRLRLLNLMTYDEYADYVFSPKGAEEELYHMIDAVTTNKTDFFREPKHFDFLRSRVLDNARGNDDGSRSHHMKVWSAGCSTGEEPYTLSIVLAEYALTDPSFNFTIMGTDISTRVLQHASTAVYSVEKIEPIPIPLRKKYLLKSKDKPLVRICPELRSRVSFMRLNFMDDHYAISGIMNAIFCRNVIIYFDRKTQEAILGRICRHLQPGGYLFMGHSETLSGMDLPLQLVTSSIYRKRHDTV